MESFARGSIAVLVSLVSGLALGCGNSRPPAGHDSGPAPIDAATFDAGTTDAGHDAAMAMPDVGHDAAMAMPDMGHDAAATPDMGHDAAMVPDVGIDAGNDAGRDAAVLPDTSVDAAMTTTCNPAGRVGAHCSAGTCAVGSMCLQYTPTTIQAAFGLPQGRDDSSRPGYSVIETPAVPAESAPFNAAEASLCAQQCDLAATTDTCGACTTCANVVTQAPLLAAFGGVRTLFGTSATFGGNTGLCRLDCGWDAASRGTGCPDAAMTCDAFSGTCVESCTSDTECNTTYGATYAGDLVTALVTSHALHCNGATGRCEPTPTTTGPVPIGSPCVGSDACTPGTGVCVNGGMCAELGCVPGGTGASICGGGSGVCLGTNQSSMAVGLCLRGCISRGDCGPGNACRSFGGVSVGPFTGYCIGVCDADTDCAANETCTDTVDTTGSPVSGRCVPRCTSVGGVGAASGGCATDQFCRADHAGATYGSCVTVDPFCGAANSVDLPAATTDCATGYVCDETLATPHTPIGAVDAEIFGDGHCVTACTGTSCTGGLTCVTTGVLAGLCRQACSAGSPTCPIDQACNTTLGFCTEVHTM